MTIFLSSGILLAGEPGGDPEYNSYDDSLFYNAGWDTIFVAGTSESNDTIAIVPLQIRYNSSEVTTISIIKFHFNYDETLELLDAYMDSSEWNGTFDIEADGTDLVITLESGSISKPTSFTTFVYLKFKLNCEEELTENPVDLSDSPFDCMVVHDDNIAYPWSNHIYSGSIVNSDYHAGFDINDIVAIGGIGKIDSIPVTAETDFYIWRLHHYIIYDNDLIEFMDFWPDDSSLWDDITYTAGEDSIVVYLQACDSCYGYQYTAKDTIYWLKFQIICTPDINGQAADILFDTLNSNIAPRSGYGVNCSYLRKPYDLADGEISVPQYDNTYKMNFACDGCDGVISKSDDSAVVMIRMKNNFPAGDTARSIIANFDMGDYFNGPVISELANSPVSYEFESHCVSGKYHASARQIHNPSKDNYYPLTPSYNDMFKLKLSANLSNISPADFDDKYVSFDFCVEYGTNPPCTSLTWDNTGTVVVKDEYNTLHLLNDSVLVLMGEFSVDKVTGGTCAATQSLYVRKTFDMEDFTLKIHSPEVGVEIQSIDTSFRSGVGYSKIDDRTYRVYSTGGFSSISANGDDYTKIAEIDYIIDGACMPEDSWIYIVPELSGDTMKNADGYDQYVVLESDSVALYCFYCGSGTPPNKLAGDREPTAMLPTEFSLYPCRPNPFNPETEVAFDLPEMCPVSIEIFNILGQKVATLIDRTMEAGRHSVIWNSNDASGRPVSSGIYLCIMRAGDFTATQKMSLLK